MKRDLLKLKRIWKYVYVPAVVAAAWFVSANWYQVSLIRGNSMSPAYHNMQFVLIDRHSDLYTYGDVVAFRCEGLDAVLIKRIAACPGDRVIVIDGTLYVNDAVSRVFSREGAFANGGIAGDMVYLGENQYFMIGDNLEESKDSRYEEVGAVDREAILGKIIPHSDGYMQTSIQ